MVVALQRKQDENNRLVSFCFRLIYKSVRKFVLQNVEVLQLMYIVLQSNLAKEVQNDACDDNKVFRAFIY